MDNSFFAYMQHLEMMAFFSGYPLVYAVVIFFSGNIKSKKELHKKTAALLPFAYALVGTLFLGLQLKKLYDGHAAGNTGGSFQQPWLTILGLLSVLFWIPGIAKKPILSLLHSFIFFFFLLKDLFMQPSASSSGGYMVRNDMNIYTSSLLLNAAAFAIVALFSFLYSHYKGRLRA